MTRLYYVVERWEKTYNYIRKFKFKIKKTASRNETKFLILIG